MSKYIFYPATKSAALLAAAEKLKSRGYGVVDRPCESVTHLLLPVPSFDADGTIKGGGNIHELLSILPKNIAIVGGFLPEIPGYKCMDLLKDAEYLCENAYITAHCAIRLAAMRLPKTFRNCKVLIIGWGRIGKCLTRLLNAMEADLTVAARKETDRAIARALGYNAITPEDIGLQLNKYRIVFNTVPHLMLDESYTNEFNHKCLKIDLASVPGIQAPDVLWARGLPGKDAPESSGNLIAKTTIRLLDRKEPL